MATYARFGDLPWLLTFDEDPAMIRNRLNTAIANKRELSFATGDAEIVVRLEMVRSFVLVRQVPDSWADLPVFAVSAGQIPWNGRVR